MPSASTSSSRASRLLGAAAAALILALVVAGCAGGGSGPRANPTQLSIAPVNGSTGVVPGTGITVSAVRGTISSVVVRTRGDSVPGSLNASGTVWHSRWPLDVSQSYTVTATAVGKSGRPIVRTSSFRTLQPKATVATRIVEGQDQTYGVGMPIVLYFDHSISNRAAVERALQIRTSKPVVGAWYWDSECGTAPVCAYFRPRHYWPEHTQVHFAGHLNGVEVAPGVYANHDLTQSFTIGSSLTVVASTANHEMKVYRSGKLFADWPISTGKPGDDTPNGNYLTIEKENPADMVGPGYNIQVPYSVRITWSGDYLHDAYWSVGDQGSSNVSHGCVNMSPENAATYYNMAVPGDPVKIVGSPVAGTWDNGWTMWFLSWKQWLRGSALHAAVRAGPQGSTFVHA